MTYTFDDTDAADRHTTQYFEIYGNRGIYHNGWIASTRHRITWEPLARARSTMTCGSSTTPARTGPSTNRGTSPRREPIRLAELQRLFILAASKYGVSRSTTAWPKGSTPNSPADPNRSRATVRSFTQGWAACPWRAS
jgi:arylsulfatase